MSLLSLAARTLLPALLAVPFLPPATAAAEPAAQPAEASVPDFANDAIRMPLPGGQWTACVGGACPHYPASAVAVSDTTSCASTHGTVWCWDASRYWQVRLPGDATRLSVGQGHACAVVGRSAQLWCWGTNHRGELGNGGTAPASPLSPVYTGLRGITSVAAAWYSTCAANRAGTAWCWGWYFGDGWGDQLSPRRMELGGVVEFTSSVSPSICARTGDGLWCTSTGDSEQGETAGRTTAGFDRRSGPVDAASLDRNFGCSAVLGAVSCWHDSDAPAPTGLTGVRSLAATDGRVCVTAGRALECRDDRGRLLLRTLSSHPLSVVRSGWQTVALAEDGDIWRWTPGHGIHQVTFLPAGR
jgi:hypothetical protein